MLLSLAVALLLGLQTPDALSALKQAAGLVHEKRWTEADALLGKLKPPLERAEVLRYYRLRAAAASALGRKSEAAAHLRNALRFDPANTYLVLATAALERAAKEYDSALARLHALPESPRVLALIAEIAAERGDRETALAAQRRAVEISPNEEQPRLNLAVSFLRAYNFDAALEALAGARSPRSLVLLALASFGAQRDAEAAKALLEAADLEPGSELPVRVLGELQLRAASTPDPAAIDRVCLWADKAKDARLNALCGGLLLRGARAERSADMASAAAERLMEAAKAAPDDVVAQCELARMTERPESRAAAAACAKLRAKPGGEERRAVVQQLLTELLAGR